MGPYWRISAGTWTNTAPRGKSANLHHTKGNFEVGLSRHFGCLAAIVDLRLEAKIHDGPLEAAHLAERVVVEDEIHLGLLEVVHLAERVVVEEEIHDNLESVVVESRC